MYSIILESKLLSKFTYICMIKLILRGVENYFKMAIFPTCRSTMNRTTQFDSITMYIVTMSKTNQSLRLTKKRKKERKENQNLKKKNHC